MKTYSSSGKAKNPKKRKLFYILTVTVSVLLIAITVTLAVVLSKPVADLPVDAPPVIDGNDGPVDVPPVDNPPIGSEVNAKLFVLPVDDATVGKEVSLTQIVYFPSVNMWMAHTGVDIAAAENTPVKVVAAGEVVGVVESNLEGVCVTVKHEDGLVSVYKSLASASVSAGDTVSAGDVIGIAGTCMKEKSEGVHVHLEMTVNGEYIDPMEYLDAEINK